MTLEIIAMLAGTLTGSPAATAHAGQTPPVPPTPTELEQPAGPDIPELPLPDLTVEAFYFPACAVVGEEIGDHLFAEVRNTGTADASENVAVGFYLSPDPGVAVGDTLLDGGREHLPGIDAGETKPVDIAQVMSVPANYPAGAAHLGVLVDESDSIAEFDETNNSKSVPISINPVSQGCL